MLAPRPFKAIFPIAAEISSPKLEESKALTNAVFAITVNIIINCKKNTKAILVTQSTSIFLYLAFSSAIVVIAILIPI